MSTAKKKVEIPKPSTVNSKITSLKFYKTNEQAQLPVFATEQSACFDMYANLIVDERHNIMVQFKQNSYPGGFLLI